MEKKTYNKLQETIFHEKLQNGLNVYIVPKEQFSKTYFTFMTFFGSSVHSYLPQNQVKYEKLPYGIAHFLEHKLFEMEDGQDASNMFSELGADSNAYTGYTETAYLATCTSKVKEVLTLLINFVQTPYFTDKNIEKEKGIIKQELLMYIDSSSSRLHNGLLQNIFASNPIREDVIGTEKDINSIDKETLYKCYNTFYHPSNMSLIVVGNVNPDEIIKTVIEVESTKTFAPIKNIYKTMVAEDAKVYKKSSSIKMDITTAKVAVAVKLPTKKYAKNEMILDEMMYKMILENIFGASSSTYQELLDLHLINTSFYTDVYLDEFCGYIKICADSEKPKQFIKYIKNKLLAIKDYKMDQDEFQAMKKAVVGAAIKSFNSLDYIANCTLEYKYKNCDIFEASELIENITLDDITKLFINFKEESICDFTILPKNRL